MAKTTSSRPSVLLDIDDPWTAYQFDCAVCSIGLAIENASMERFNAGSDQEPNWINRYTMRELLDPEFKLPLADSWGLEDELMGTEGIVYDKVG